MVPSSFPWEVESLPPKTGGLTDFWVASTWYKASLNSLHLPIKFGSGQLQPCFWANYKRVIPSNSQVWHKPIVGRVPEASSMVSATPSPFSIRTLWKSTHSGESSPRSTRPWFSSLSNCASLWVIKHGKRTSMVFQSPDEFCGDEIPVSEPHPLPCQGLH